MSDTAYYTHQIDIDLLMPDGMDTLVIKFNPNTNKLCVDESQIDLLRGFIEGRYKSVDALLEIKEINGYDISNAKPRNTKKSGVGTFIDKCIVIGTAVVTVILSALVLAFCAAILAHKTSLIMPVAIIALGLGLLYIAVRLIL